MKIEVKQDLCCAAGLCVQVAPGVFKLDELGYNASNGADVPAGLEDLAKRGADICPESAIHLIDASKASK